MGFLDNLKKMASVAAQKTKITAEIAKFTMDKKKLMGELGKIYKDAAETLISLYREKKDISALEPLLQDFISKIEEIEAKIKEIDQWIAEKKREAEQLGIAIDDEEVEQTETADTTEVSEVPSETQQEPGKSEEGEI
jgi:predicted  nucleic acid-binding Zn-ribbon protein